MQEEAIAEIKTRINFCRDTSQYYVASLAPVYALAGKNEAKKILNNFKKQEEPMHALSYHRAFIYIKADPMLDNLPSDAKITQN